MRLRPLPVAAVAMTALVAASAAAVMALGSGGEAGRATSIAGSSYPRWPAETLADWAGFADQVSVLTVTGERRLPLDARAAETGEGLVGRRVTAQIESTLWNRRLGPNTTGAVELSVDGWALHEGAFTPIVPLGAHRLEVGDRIVAALTLTPEGNWSLLSAGAAIPLGPADSHAGERAVAGPAFFRGLTVSQISVRLAAARPSALAEKYQHLDPDGRARAVWDEMLAEAND